MRAFRKLAVRVCVKLGLCSTVSHAWEAGALGEQSGLRLFLVIGAHGGTWFRTPGLGRKTAQQWTVVTHEQLLIPQELPRTLAESRGMSQDRLAKKAQAACLEDISSPKPWLVLKITCGHQQMSGKNNCGHLPAVRWSLKECA